MKKDINVFTLTGRLTRDAELTYANAGTAVCNFSIAYTRNIKQGDGWQDKSCFINASMFGKRAESLSQYLTKGQQVVVSGELDHQTWVDSISKNNRSKHQLVNIDVQLVGGRKESAPTGNSTSDFPPFEAGKSNIDEDDIPF